MNIPECVYHDDDSESCRLYSGQGCCKRKGGVEPKMSEAKRDDSDLSAFLCDHDLEVVDQSFDHEYGCEQVFYYRCSVCDATHEEDGTIPDQVDT